MQAKDTNVLNFLEKPNTGKGLKLFLFCFLKEKTHIQRYQSPIMITPGSKKLSLLKISSKVSHEARNNLNSLYDTVHPAQVNATAELGSRSALITNKQAAPLRNRNGFSETKQEHALAC